MKDSPESKLDKVRKALYSKTANLGESHPTRFSKKEYDVEEDWEESEVMPKKTDKNQHSFWYKFLMFSVIFFIFALALAVFIFWRGTNIISSENVEIIVNGPVSIGAGEELSFQVSILNRNNVALENAELTIEYPPGTVDPLDPTEDLTRTSESLERIASGERVQKVMKAILFGEENDKKTIDVTVEYRVEGSNAIFYKEKSYEMVISSAPISLLVTGPEKVSSGQEVEVSITVASNSDRPINNTALAIEYPFGFLYKSATVEPSSNNNFWTLGTLNPEEQKKIKVRGIMEGQNDEERVFRVEVGTGELRKITTLFTSFLHPISIEKPALAIDISVDGERGREVTTLPGETVRVDLSWKNTLSNQIAEAVASTKVSTSGFKLNTISVPNGYFRSSDNTILWTKDSDKTLAFLNPGESGVLSFNLKIPTINELSGPGGVFENPNISLATAMKANDLAVSGDAGVVQSQTERVIKISSPISATASVFKKSDNLYGVVITVKNPFNVISGTKWTASLPTYVKWMDSYAPAEENIDFNTFGGQILWNIGKLAPGIGYVRESRQLSFEVELAGDLEGLGNNPILLKDLKIVGMDNYTGKEVTYSISQVRVDQ